MKHAVYFILAALLVGCGLSPNSQSNILFLEGPSGEFLALIIEVADSTEERQRGLMGRAQLSEDQGMLFVFPNERKLSFWMKNTLIPLDILFFDASGQFVSSETMEPCTSDPCPRYSSEGLSQYVVEVNKGYVALNGVGKGWKIILDQLSIQYE